MSRRSRVVPLLAAILLLVIAALIFGPYGSDFAPTLPTADPTASASDPTPPTPDLIPPDSEVASVELAGVPERTESTATVAADLIVGRIVADRENGGSLPTSLDALEIVLQSSPPGFVREPNRVPRGVTLEVAPVALDGTFELVAHGQGGYLDVNHPFVRPSRSVLVESGERDVELPVSVGGAIRGVVVGPDGAPIAGASVKVGYILSMATLTKDVAIAQLGKKSETDAEGNFELTGIPPGQMMLSTQPEGYPPQPLEVAVVAGRYTDVEITVQKGLRLKGRVIDERGGPITDAQITVRLALVELSRVSSGSTSTDKLTGETDPSGEFAIGGFSPGTYDVIVTSTRFAKATREGVVLSSTDVTLADPIVMKRGLTISGIAIDEEGSPVASATIAFMTPSKVMGFSINQSVDPANAEEIGGAVTKTSADGTFTSPPLSPGDYEVAANAKQYLTTRNDSVAAGTTDLKVTLQRAGTVTGVVLDDDTTEPVPRYRVGLRRPISFFDPASFVPGPSTQVASPVGKFALDEVPPGKWTLVVQSEGFAEYESDEFEIQAGDERRGVVVMLLLESAIEGRVVDRRNGVPVPGASITTRTGIDQLRQDPLASLRDVKSDAQGRFRLGGLAAGSYRLQVSATDYAPGASGAVVVRDYQVVRDVEIGLDRGAVLFGVVRDAQGEPEKGALIQAILLGTMFPAMTTTADDGSYELTGLGGGTYTVNKIGGTISSNPAKTMSSLMPGLMSKTVEVNVSERVELNFDGHREGVIVRGEVTSGGEPQSQCFITFLPVDVEGVEGSDLRMATSGDHGEYEVIGLPPGEWTATLQANGTLSDTQRESFDLSIPDQPEFIQDFELSVTGLTGVVLAADTSRPIAGLRVAVNARSEDATVDAFARRAGSSRVADIFTGPDGAYRISGLRPGRYRVVAGGTGMFGMGGGYQESDPIEVEIAEGQMVRAVDFRLRKGAALEGSVSDEAGHGVPGAALFFMPSDGTDERHFAEVMTDETGRFRADGLKPASYRIGAKGGGYAPTVLPSVTLRSGETTQRDFVLRRAGRVILVVRNENGDPVLGARISLVDATGLDYTRFVSIGDAMLLAGAKGAGTYDLGPMPSGFYVATVTTAEGSSTTDVQHGGTDQVVEVEVE